MAVRVLLFLSLLLVPFVLLFPELFGLRNSQWTNTPALLSLLYAPWGSDPAFFIIWNRFRQLRRYLSYRPDDEARIFRLLDYASAGSPGHGPIHLLIQSADELGFFWDSEQAGWIRPGLPPLRMMTGPIQHFRTAIWQAWQHKVVTGLCKRKGFRGGFGFDFYGSHQLLVSSHFEKETKCCFEPFFLVEFGMASCLARLRKKMFLVGFVVLLIMMAIFFGTAPFLLLLNFVINLSFFLS